MSSKLALTLLLSYLTGILVAGAPAEMENVVESCLTENGVTRQEFEDLGSGKTQPADVKDNVKCATQCLLQKGGFLDAEGNLNTDAFKKEFASIPLKDEVEKALDNCASLKGANPCDTAFQMLSCVEAMAKSISSQLKG